MRCVLVSDRDDQGRGGGIMQHAHALQNQEESGRSGKSSGEWRIGEVYKSGDKQAALI